MQQAGASITLPNETARCLHLVVGAGRDVLDDCLACTVAADAVVFLDAGVLQLLREPTWVKCNATLYFVDADLRAHGLLKAALRAEASVLDDAGVCGLLAQFDHCLTWR